MTTSNLPSARAQAAHQAFHKTWGGPDKPLDLYVTSPIWEEIATAVNGGDSFPPGTRVVMKGRAHSSTRNVFLVLVGGYTTEADWTFHSCSPNTFTTKDFEPVVD